jgi:DNA-directed RNA polymerase subunit RPC12/RpoP
LSRFSGFLHIPDQRDVMGLAKLSCFLWGHHVDNHVFKQAEGHDRRCRCGSEYLAEDRSLTRVRHTLSCFLGKHDYEKLADRDGCHEYVCTQCGHPLLFDAEQDPYAASPTFKKKVRYLCGLFGHRARHITTRDGFQEYACFCGHSFLKETQVWGKIRHPAICVVAGHFIHFLAKRGGFAEYVCVNCGHPFCFAYHASHEAAVDDRADVRPGHAGVHAVHARAS